MTVVRKTLDPNEAPGLSQEALDRLESLSPQDIEANALTDPDNPPTSEAEFARGLFGRRVRLVREKLGLSQKEFAARFQINLRRFQDWEQGRVAPDSAISAYLTLIEREPEMVRRILEVA
jgi:putative transcriptional regulator